MLYDIVNSDMNIMEIPLPSLYSLTPVIAVLTFQRRRDQCY